MRLLKEIYKDNISFINDIMQLAYKTIDLNSHLCFNLMKPPSVQGLVLRTSYEEEQTEGVQEKSNKYLHTLYVLSRRDQSKQFDMYEIGKINGYGTVETESIVETLSRSELLYHDRILGKVSITPYGIMIMKGEITVGYAPIH